jgi:hypothetical protein
VKAALRAALENPGAGDEADDRADPVAHFDVPDEVVHDEAPCVLLI